MYKPFQYENSETCELWNHFEQMRLHHASASRLNSLIACISGCSALLILLSLVILQTRSWQQEAEEQYESTGFQSAEELEMTF